jgi:hypothetical protein
MAVASGVRAFVRADKANSIAATPADRTVMLSVLRVAMAEKANNAAIVTPTSYV